MTADAVNIIPEPWSPRQLGDEGLVVFWRDGREHGQRQGLACILSICPHPECACRLVYVDGFVIDEQATAVSWDEDGVHVTSHTGTALPRVTLEEKMIAIVDPASGETTAHADLPDATNPALVDWLGSEMDEELLEVLHRFRARAKGDPPERPRTDIDLEDRDQYHPVAFDELFDGTRADDYLLAGVSVRSSAPIAGGVRSPAGLDGERTLLDAKYGTS